MPWWTHDWLEAINRICTDTPSALPVCRHRAAPLLFENNTFWEGPWLGCGI